jgi:hypothetical protein
MKNKLTTSIFAGAIAIGALGVSGAAMAQVRVGINVGVPAPVYVAPQPVYVAPQPVYAPPPPPVVYAPPPPVYVGAPVVVVGWHGDRYWDGRRYWNRNDWYHYHGGPRYDHRGWH